MVLTKYVYMIAGRIMVPMIGWGIGAAATVVVCRQARRRATAALIRILVLDGTDAR